MRIVFNLHRVGLGNNGGSRTLIRSAETLQSLGAEVYIYSDCANKYTWHRTDIPMTRKPIKCDAVIATGYNSVASTMKYNCDKKLYYVRGFELWVTSEKNLLRSYKPLHCIVNSEWLLGYMTSKGIYADLVYPGLDFDQYRIVQNKRTPVLGGLFHTRHKTKRHCDVEAVANKLGCSLVMLNRDLKNGNPNQVRDFYQKTSVWMAPTELEGLHNPPMEACLCGNAVVRSDHARGGMADYADDDTALVYPARDISAAVKCVEKLLYDDLFRQKKQQAMEARLRSKIGTREANMRRLMEIVQT